MIHKTILCPVCKNPMKFWKSKEKKLDDRMLHLIDEYVCPHCGKEFENDLGLVVPEK